MVNPHKYLDFIICEVSVQEPRLFFTKHTQGWMLSEQEQATWMLCLWVVGG